MARRKRKAEGAMSEIKYIPDYENYLIGKDGIVYSDKYKSRIITRNTWRYLHSG